MKIDSLAALDLSDGQIAVYSACLELGIAGVGRIQEKTGIERRNIYDILNKLIERGFISYTTEKGKRVFQCTHPNKIEEELKAKRENLEQLSHRMSQIKELFALSRPNISAEVLRGNEAIKAMFEDMLTQKEVRFLGGNSFNNYSVSSNFSVWFNHWMKRRAESKVMMLDLVDYGTHLKGVPPKNKILHKKIYYKYCQLPKNLSSPMVIAIWGNKVAQILWGEQPFAFVLESEVIRDSFLNYFNAFWKEP